MFTAPRLNDRARRFVHNHEPIFGILYVTARNHKYGRVGSTIQCNTFVLMLQFREGGMYGSNGTPWSVRLAEVGALATLEGRRIA